MVKNTSFPNGQAEVALQVKKGEGGFLVGKIGFMEKVHEEKSKKKNLSALAPPG